MSWSVLWPIQSDSNLQLQPEKLVQISHKINLNVNPWIGFLECVAPPAWLWLVFLISVCQECLQELTTPVLTANKWQLNTTVETATYTH